MLFLETYDMVMLSYFSYCKASKFQVIQLCGHFQYATYKEIFLSVSVSFF